MNALRRVSIGESDKDAENGIRPRSGSSSPKDNKVQSAATGSKILASSSRQKYQLERPVAPVPAATGSDNSLSGSMVKLAVSDAARASSRASVGASKSSPAIVDNNQPARREKARSLRGIPSELRDQLGKLEIPDKPLPPLIAQLKNDNFRQVNEHLIRCMSPEERYSLKMALDEARKLKATPEIDNCLQWYKTITEQLLDKQLMELITNKGSVKIDEFRTLDLWSLLFTANESIISTERLFGLILREIRESSQAVLPAAPNESKTVQTPPNPPETKMSPRAVKTIKLQLFCQKWLEENRSNELVLKAKNSIEEIIAATAVDAVEEIRTQCERLKKEFALAVKPQAVPDLAIPYAKSFRKIFKDFKDISDDSTLIINVAQDLMQYQMLLFRNLTPSHLIATKWGGAGSFQDRIVRFNVAITEYLVDLILSQPDKEVRTNILKFFIKVENAALEGDDFATAFAIYLACNNSEVLRLRTTWELVNKSSTCRKIRDDHEKSLTVVGNSTILRGLIETAYGKFRKQQDKSHRFVPCLHLILGDIIHCGEQPRIFTREGCDPEFNFENMAKICSLIQQILMPQRVMKSDEEFFLQTDFVPVCITHVKSSDHDRKKLSEKYDSPRTSSRGS